MLLHCGAAGRLLNIRARAEEISLAEMITDVSVKDAGRKGKGVFALRDFKKGEFLIYCAGAK